jgi:hypothetical protein
MLTLVVSVVRSPEILLPEPDLIPSTCPCPTTQTMHELQPRTDETATATTATTAIITIKGKYSTAIVTSPALDNSMIQVFPALLPLHRTFPLASEIVSSRRGLSRRQPGQLLEMGEPASLASARPQLLDVEMQPVSASLRTRPGALVLVQM